MLLGKEQRMPATKCLECGHELDAMSGIGNDVKPVAGDITICIMCGHIMAFNADLSLRELTDAEAMSVAGDPIIIGFNAIRAKAVKATRPQ